MSALTHKSVPKAHETFTDFYAAYLTGHTDRISRQLHFIGTSLALLFLAGLALTAQLWWLVAAVVSFYGFAWAGHFMFEKNQPRSFKQPFYSFAAAWLMYWQMLTGQISF